MLKPGFFFALGTILSRVVGLVRESVIAATFGAGFHLDAFLVANRIPNLMRELVAEGAFGSSFTKIFAQIYNQSQEKATQFYQFTFSCALASGLLLSAIGIYMAPQLVHLIVKNESAGAEFIKSCTFLVRVLFPFITIMMLVALSQGALYGRNKFFLSAASPIALSLGYILGATWLGDIFEQLLSPSFDFEYADRRLFSLAIGVLLGGMGSLLLQTASINRVLNLQHLQVWKCFSKFRSEIKQLCLLMGPMVLASSAGQINVMVNTYFATSLEHGAVSWLNLSFRLVQLPVGVFAVGAAAVLLPQLSVTYQSSDKSKTQHLLYRTSRTMIWTLIPCACFLYLSATEVIMLIYKYGVFSLTDVRYTAECLQAYAIGLLGYGLVKVWTVPYYAHNHTQGAMVISIVGIAINYALNSILVTRYGAWGLALTSSTLLFWQALMLGGGLCLLKVPMSWNRLIKDIFLTFTCAAFAFALHTWIKSLSYWKPIEQTHRILLAIQVCILGLSVMIPFILAAQVFLNFKIFEFKRKI
ncbi:MAG: murein biosynthesis integral membrane protein MurJ [Zetaproteobacteria bacterium]|nr:murein biosynthesis integral membrane protein MurJ [Zetaproteobacteria bacterium]